MDNKTPNNNVLIKKNNRYIRATLCFSDVLEKKIVLLAISKIDSYKAQGLIDVNEPKQIDFYLSASEIKDILGISSNDFYNQLKTISYKIASRVIELELNNSFAFITPFPYCYYNNGILHLRSELSMFNTLVNYNDSSGFSQWFLESLKNIRSAYTIAGYEILHSYLYLHQIEITVEQFKQMIGIIEAIPKNPKKPLSYVNRVLIDKMPRYTDFRRYILEPMKKSLAAYTDIKFTYVPKQKIGKKVISLLFIIDENPAGKNNTNLPAYKRTRVLIPEKDKPYVEELKTFLPKTTKNKDFLELLQLSNYNIDKIKELYEYTKTKGNKVRAPLSYIKKGLQEEWSVSTNIETSKTPYKLNTSTQKNKFNDFPQREYTKEQYEQLELKLMNIDYFTDKKD